MNTDDKIFYRVCLPSAIGLFVGLFSGMLFGSCDRMMIYGNELARLKDQGHSCPECGAPHVRRDPKPVSP